MQISIFEISKMDCPSEENLIRMKLSEIINVAHLDFDIPNRKLTVFHYGEIPIPELKNYLKEQNVAIR